MTQQNQVKFLHLDMDAFFAAVEILERPELADKPVIIGHRVGRSVVSSANYPARRFGVRSAMPVAQALRLCPNAEVIVPDHKKYRKFSKQIIQIMEEFTPLVEQLSIDEAFLDISGAYKLFDSAEEIAEKLRTRIKAETGLVSSVGGSEVKFVAKIASGKAKPNGVLIVPKSETLNFLHPLPVQSLWGIGAKSHQKLAELAVKTIGDLAKLDYKVLKTKLGEAAAHKLLQLANGQDDRSIVLQSQVKSISHEHTFGVDTANFEILKLSLLQLSEAVAKRARAKNLKGATVSIKFRTDKFQTFSRSKTMSYPSNTAQRIYQLASELLAGIWQPGTKVRLVGVRLEQLNSESLDLLWNEDAQWQAVEAAEDQLAKKFGSSLITPASLLKRSPEERLADDDGLDLSGLN